MRILQICDTYPPDRGGLAAHVQRLSRRLADRGHDVMVMAPGVAGAEPCDEPFPVRRPGLSFARLPGVYEPGSPPFHPPWPDPGFTREIDRAGAEFEPDVVHAHGWCMYSAAARAPAWANRVVATMHDHGLACPKKTLLRRGAVCRPARGPACLRCDGMNVVKRAGLAAAQTATTPRLERRVRHLLAVSSYVSARAEQAGVSAELLTVVPNFVDVPDEAALRRDQCVSRPYLLYAGPESPHKGRHVLLDAFASLGRNIELRLVGAEQAVAAPGVVDLGYRTGDALARLYRGASCLVVPSIWADPCPTVALEAMAWETPVVGTSIGGLTDIVEHGVSGLLVPPGDPQALGQAIADLLADDDAREEMGRQARARVIAGFSTDAIVPRLETIYGGIASEP